MKTPIRSFSLAFTLAAASLLGATAAHAQTVINALPYVITSPGSYVLNNNLNSAQTSGNLIEIQASNVTLDFQGHYIAGPVNNTAQTTYGIYASEQSNLNIKNGTVAFCRNGIQIVGNGQANTNNVGHQIDNMRVTYCYQFGIYISNSPATVVSNCQISQTGYSGQTSAYGIVTFGVGAMTIYNNIVGAVTASTNNYGIFVSNSSFSRQNTVSNCTIGVAGGKYQDNLTANCTTPYTGGTDAGGNN